MRRANKGVFTMDVALSISYEPYTGSICALLLTTSDEQLEFMLHQTIQLKVLTPHPLLLPTLLCTNSITILQSLVSQRTREYLEAERASGQSVWDPLGPYNAWGLSPPTTFEDFNGLTRAILRIAQLMTAYSNYFHSTFHAIESIEEALKYVSSITPPQREYASSEIGAILGERLRYVYHGGKSTFGELQTVNDRTRFQMNAVNGYSSCPFCLCTDDAWLWWADLQPHCS